MCGLEALLRRLISFHEFPTIKEAKLFLDYFALLYSPQQHFLSTSGMEVPVLVSETTETLSLCSELWNAQI